MKVFILAIIILAVVMILSMKVFAQAPAQEKNIASDKSVNVFSFTMKDIDEQDVNLADFKGKTLLIVNTASKCGYTPQYAALEQLYQEYKDRGFVVLAFPANNFMGQEPGSDKEIKDFCLLKYKTTFPVFAKTSVKGGDINPLYRYLTTQAGFDGPIKWNFNKFLVSPDGEVVARFDSSVEPKASELVAQLQQILPQK
jgi:glutathione peroxidase